MSASTWTLILMWAHITGGWQSTVMGNIPDEKQCQAIAKEVIRALEPWRAKVTCVESGKIKETK